MKQQYLYFILGLQQQLKNVLFNKVTYPYSKHAWLYNINPIFFIRDFHTHQLMFDDTQAFAHELKFQGLQQAYLVPLSILNLDQEKLRQHQSVDFDFSPQPILVMRIGTQWQCLLPCHEKTTQHTHVPNHTDPRDFMGFESTQDHESFYSFTLFNLNIEQTQRVQEFAKPLDWQAYLQKLDAQIYPKDGSPYPYPRSPLVLSTNLKYYDEDDLFLADISTQPNLAFSYFEELKAMLINMNGYQHPRNESSEFHWFEHEKRTEFLAFETALKHHQLTLCCHIANQYERACIEKNELYHLLNQQKIPHTEEEFTSTSHNFSSSDEASEQNTEATPLSLVKSLIHLVIFLAVVITILYGFYWLSLRFAFVNWLFMLFGVIAFLVIIARK